ncbi:MAG TPA: holo-ACP synthase [Jatrophihabitans sp.]|nr:holo-ACP synthase [Jatrophihabitans sp.]
MQVAVGVDMVDVRRLRRLLEDNPLGAPGIFTPHELAYCATKPDRYPHLAARLAAKEAFLKAFGNGLRRGHHWTDVEVRNDSLGRPLLRLFGRLAADVAARGGTSDVSLSHAGDYAIAHVSLVFAAGPPDPAPTSRRNERHPLPASTAPRSRPGFACPKCAADVSAAGHRGLVPQRGR